MCRILKHAFYHTSDFEQKLQQRNRFSRETRFEKSIFLGQFALKKFSIFWSIYILKMYNLALSHFHGKLVSESVVFELKTSIESKNLKRVRFRINFFTTPQIFKQKTYFVLKFELNFHIASELESRFFQRIRFRSKKFFSEKSKFVVKLAFKDSFSWSINTVKTSMLAFLCILGKVVPVKNGFYS